jgi:ribosomal protein S27E
MSQSVTITVPITITVSLGAAVVQNVPSLQVGVNRGLGWYCRCPNCRKHRHLMLYVHPDNARAAYCNVCEQIVLPPISGGGEWVQPVPLDPNVLLDQQAKRKPFYDPNGIAQV